VIRRLLICGLAAGVCAGLLAAGFASLAAEPAIDSAIAYEDSRAHAAGTHSHTEATPVPRAVQKSAGLVAAAVLYGAALGGIFALVFAFAYGRVGRASPRVTAYWLAAAAFTALSLVPFVKYPAMPPGAGDPDTIGRRTALYLTMIAVSVLAGVAAVRLRPALQRRTNAHTATVIALLAYVAIVAAAGVALPDVDEVPADFPATTLARFREASIGMQATMWATIGLIFAFAAQRVMTSDRSD
jgi:predicted cobalt transporter CbtA